MKIGNVSTYALNNNLRIQMNRTHAALAEAQKEVATGKKADIGYSLGSFTSSTITVTNQINYIEQTKVTNSFVENRLSTMQLSMSRMVSDADEFIKVITAEITGTLDKGLVHAAGVSAVGKLTSTMNITLGGEYLFSGINSDSEALHDYQGTSGAPAKAAVQAAFVTEFGFAVTDPAAENITPAQLKSFIDGAYSDLFNDTNWDNLWTGSSERGMRSKISTRELVENPTTGHAQAFREFAKAAVLMEEFGNGQLNETTMDQMANSSIEIMATSVSMIGIEQSKVGVIEERVNSATERLEFQKNILSTQEADLTGVDPYEAANRLNQIVVGMEASYAATVRVQSLSILQFV